MNTEFLQNNKILILVGAAGIALLVFVTKDNNKQTLNKTVLLQTGDTSAGVQGPGPDPHAYRNPGPYPGPIPIPPEPQPIPIPNPNPHHIYTPGPMPVPAFASGGSVDSSNNEPTVSHSYLSRETSKFRIAQANARNRV